jgi:hypothetical protein
MYKICENNVSIDQSINSIEIEINNNANNYMIARLNMDIILYKGTIEVLQKELEKNVTFDAEFYRNSNFKAIKQLHEKIDKLKEKIKRLKSKG